MSKKAGKRLLIIVLTAAVLLLIVLLFPSVRKLSAYDIVNWSPASPILAALLLLGIYCAKNILMFIPLLVLYVAASLMFPLQVAIPLTYLGLAAEMSIGYGLGRKMGAARVNTLLNKNKKAAAFFGLLNRNNKTACFLARLIPLPVPLDAVSMFYGALGVPFLSYLFSSLLGISSTMIPIVIAGQAISNPFSLNFLLPFGISLLISTALMLLSRLMEKKQLNKISLAKKADGATQTPPKEDANLHE